MEIFISPTFSIRGELERKHGKPFKGNCPIPRIHLPIKVAIVQQPIMKQPYYDTSVKCHNKKWLLETFSLAWLSFRLSYKLKFAIMANMYQYRLRNPIKFNGRLRDE